MLLAELLRWSMHLRMLLHVLLGIHTCLHAQPGQVVVRANAQLPPRLLDVVGATPIMACKLPGCAVGAIPGCALLLCF